MCGFFLFAYFYKGSKLFIDPPNGGSMPTKHKWQDVRDFMNNVLEHNCPDSVMVEAVRRMQIVVVRLCHERGLDEDPKYQFGPEVGLGHESSTDFERLKAWYEQHKPPT